MKRTIVISILILIVYGLVFMSYAQAGDLSQDDSGTWRINTFPKGQGNIPRLMFGSVYELGKGNMYQSFYGPADNMDCSFDISARKERAIKTTDKLVAVVTSVLGVDKYYISTSVSVCYPNWFVLYLHDGKDFVDKNVYDRIMKPLNLE